MILKRLDPADRLYADVQSIAEAGQEAANLTKRLLAFGRKQVLKPTVLDLNEVIRNSANLLERVLGEGIRLTLCLSDRPSLVRADPVQMNQVLLNFATNSLDAMSDGGVIRIETASEAEGQIRLSVSDNGAGMDSATQNRIFEPFFTTKVRSGGTGLGLGNGLRNRSSNLVARSELKVNLGREPASTSFFRLFRNGQHLHQRKFRQPGPLGSGN